MFKRDAFKELKNRLLEPRRTIQVLWGPRQVGKTTLVQQVMQSLKKDFYFHYASADIPALQNQAWIEKQWEVVRVKGRESGKRSILILDEIQKIPQWSSTVKFLWDDDTFHRRNIMICILESAPLLIQSGLSESLAGRFETIHIGHWSYLEMSKAFGLSLKEFIYFGGYPGGAPFVQDESRWQRYIAESLIETSISRDILLMTRINKPALLRQVFQLSCDYSGQILSYQKMLGQLDDAGNTTTIAHYLNLLEGAGLVKGLEKASLSKIKQRASSPKLQVLNTALMAAQLQSNFDETSRDPTCWGRFVESAVGAYLVNQGLREGIEVYYWREGSIEVDFVLKKGKFFLGIEVKSGLQKGQLSHLAAFKKTFSHSSVLQVGGQGMSLELFFATPLIHFFDP